MFLGIMIAFAIISFTCGVFLFCMYGVKSKETREEYYVNSRKSNISDFTNKLRK